MVGAGTALAHGVVTVMGCGAQGTAGAGSTLPPATTPDARSRLQRAAAECVRAGEACLTHCITSLASGDTMMAQCAPAVRQMLAICRAVEQLATTNSAHLVDLARICLATCTECEAACRPHAGHHVECGECATACTATIAAARALIG